MTENEREEVGCVHKNEASPVLALMVQMRLGERLGACRGAEAGGERVGMQEGRAEGV